MGGGGGLEAGMYLRLQIKHCLVYKVCYLEGKRGVRKGMGGMVQGN